VKVDDVVMSNNGNPASMPVTVVGLGLMGQALAAAFLKAGHPTTVWNRTAAKADELVAAGATRADSVADAFAAGPLVVVCVTDYDAVHAVLDPTAVAGRTVVNLTSGTSAQGRATAARLGGTYLDGAIMAAPPAIGTPAAVILYSGSKAGYDDHASTLGVLGSGTYLGEDHGLAALNDVATLSLMWSILNGFLQGAAILGTAGVPASTFVGSAKENLGTVASWLDDYARQIDDGEFPVSDATVGTHLAAMHHLVEESDTVGVNGELPRFFVAFAERAVAAGHGDRGYAALVEQFRTRAAVRA
jgi:3-hydroxyisobutyrate dehydrogenase-like beta-hydroxyacid dehydrogenase